MLCSKVTVIVNDQKKKHSKDIDIKAVKVGDGDSAKQIKDAKLKSHGIIAKDKDGKIVATVDGHNYGKEKVEEVIGMGQIDYASLSGDDLIGLIGHSAPQVTRNAVWTLRGREGGFLPRVVKLIKEGTVIEKRSAIGFVGYKCQHRV